MIYKSYLVEQDVKKIEKKIGLFYGENIGLINDLKQLIKNSYKNSNIIRLNEEEILKQNNILLKEISNDSLFEEEKIIFINQVSDKTLDFIVEIEKLREDKKVYLFSAILEKKSKLRNYFEKSDHCFIVPCYEDNEITLKKIIHNALKDFKGITTQNLNLILENCRFNRAKLNNELNKIKVFFHDKILDTEKLENLLNIKTNDDFDKIKDAALLGKKETTNELLSDTVFESDKNIFYLNTINQRLKRLLEISNDNKNIEKAVNNVKPPIFWKDKPNFIAQAKIWDSNKIKSTMKVTYNLEIKIKSNSSINKQILIKKLLIDLCELANSS
tara:strand:+ start:250 stop:1236 length:987 start_codon:yes stop_codon:yes gene_type:complete